MLMPEPSYAFRNEIMQIHKKDRRDYSLVASPDELAIENGIQILIPDTDNEIILTAAKDFADYLLVSMGLSSSVGTKATSDRMKLTLCMNTYLGDVSDYMGHRISVTDGGITLEAYDERGAAQGFYLLEDLMNLRRGPFLKKTIYARKALFRPRMTHSPVGAFEYTEEALSLIAHMGFDAIEIWMKDGDHSLCGYLDVNLLCTRAKKYGIDVYARFHIEHSAHPEDKGAQAFYDAIYGEFLKKFPLIKGMMIVGEAMSFKSRDPKVKKTIASSGILKNIPTGNFSSNNWPCYDYPLLVKMIYKAVRKYRSDIDLIVCTYNWGKQPEEDRLKLIEALPDGVILMATWDMHHQFKVGEATETITDYSLSFEGPGEYFTSEAIAAKRRGMTMHAISNTSGKTWDFGVIPYEPMPYQWIKRYRAILKAREDWGLRGLRENIHYGFYPSFVTELEKFAFFTELMPMEEVLAKLLARDFGEENLAIVDRAMHVFSDALKHYIPTNEDQYGAYRVGPSFPFWTTGPYDHKTPCPPHAFWGNTIYTSRYKLFYGQWQSLPGVRIFAEIPEAEKLRDKLLEGIELLRTVENPNDRLLKLINLGEFMYRCVITVIHQKRFFILLSKLQIAETRENAENILQGLEEILHAERANAEATIPLVRVDSSLGWEPSMEYTTNEECLRWKIAQVDFELNSRIPMMRISNWL